MLYTQTFLVIGYARRSIRSGKTLQIHNVDATPHIQPIEIKGIREWHAQCYGAIGHTTPGVELVDLHCRVPVGGLHVISSIQGERIMKKRGLITPLAVAVAVAMGSGSALATTTNVDLSSYYNGNWADNGFNAPGFVAALKGGTGNTGTGLTFSDPDAMGVNSPSGSMTSTLTFTPISLTSKSFVNTLFNEGYGPAGLTVIFTNSANQTATYTLESGATARDFNNDFFYDTLTGTGTGVTAQIWWSTDDAGNNGNGEPSQRLDAQTFTLPAAWAGTDLTGVSFGSFGPMIDGYPGFGILSAMAVDATATGPITSVPEPGGLGLLGAGLAILGGLVLLDRRRAHAVA